TMSATVLPTISSRRYPRRSQAAWLTSKYRPSRSETKIPSEASSNISRYGSRALTKQTGCTAYATASARSAHRDSGWEASGMRDERTDHWELPAVSPFMTRQVVTIDRTASLADAHHLMREHEIRHLPVLDGKQLVGLLSQRDLHLIETLGDAVDL